MKSIGELKKEETDKVSALIKECSMFFAFSNEQFHANKTPLQPDEKYVDMGSGCFLPKGKAQTYRDGIKAINKWYKDAVKDNNLRRENIEYALNNHEATYTGEIEDALIELGDDYSPQEVQEVLRQMMKLEHENA